MRMHDDVNEDTTMAVCYVGLLPVAALKCGCSPRGFPSLNFLDFHYAFVPSCLSHSTLALSLCLFLSLSLFHSRSCWFISMLVQKDDNCTWRPEMLGNELGFSLSLPHPAEEAGPDPLRLRGGRWGGPSLGLIGSTSS